MGGAKKNHVIQRALQSFADPPGPAELICQARGSRGGNKVDVMLPDGYHALVILPAKFRKQIWIRKGGFVIVQVTLDEEDGAGQRSFNGEIVRVLLKDDEKHLRGLDGGKYWPERWCLDDGERGEAGETGEAGEAGETGVEEDQEDEARDGQETRSDSSEDELPAHLQRVSNRRRVQYQDDSSSSGGD